MPNGKQGDGLLSDMILYGRHPFPIRIEELLLELLEMDPHLQETIRTSKDPSRWDQYFEDWNDRIGVDEGVAMLTARLEELRAERGD